MYCLIESHEPLKLITEGTGDNKSMYLIGPGCIAEKVNRNGRIYKSRLLETEVSRFNEERVQAGNAFGHLEHSSDLNPIPERYSHRVVDIQRDGNTWHVKSRLMNTPCGQVIRGILESAGSVGYSTFGGGDITKRPDGVKEVTTFHLLGFDVVSNPSIARNVEAILEAVQFNVVDGCLARIVDDARSNIRKAERTGNLTEAKKFELFSDFIMQICN
jgi:hypothetical protein